MGKTSQEASRTELKGRERVRAALLDAAMALLPERAPSTVAGRELADRAGVNYGFIHHYFGGKDHVLRAAMRRMREQFLQRHPDPSRLRLVTSGDPYLRAIARSQIDDPGAFGPADDFPVGAGMLAGVKQRMGPQASGAEVKARVIALLSLQITYGAYQPMLFNASGTTPPEQAEVEAALCRIYDELAAFDDHQPRSPQ